MSSTQAHQPKRIKLIAWAVQEAGTSSHLPILDPDGLYAVSLLQARRGAKVALGDIEIELQGPSSFLHSNLPCLEDALTGVVLAERLPSLEAYSWKLAGKKAERSLLEEDDNLDQKRMYKNTALLQYVMTNLHPLIHQILFSKNLFDSHTSKVYQSGLGSVSQYSLPNRLRRQLQTMYADRGRNLRFSNNELGTILLEQNTQKHLVMEDRREREKLAQRAGIGISGGVPTNLNKNKTASGISIEEKEKANIAFIELRTISFAEKIFDTLSESLGSNKYFSGTEKPSKLDLRIFSLLAPLLLPEQSYTFLAKSAISQTLRKSYPTLINHSESIRSSLWPFEISSASLHQILTPDWPILPGHDKIGKVNDEPLSIRIASQLGRSTSQAFIFAKRLTSSITSSSSKQTNTNTNSANDKDTSDESSKKKPLSANEKREAKMITIGKYVWIASAIIGTIGTAFASGLLAIQFVEEEEEEIENEVKKEDGVIPQTVIDEEVLLEEDDLAETEIDEDQVIDEDDDSEMEDDWEEEMEEEEDLFDDDDE